ncbi:hypothetical protein GX50_02422 [[Emmonsia] crescens]|uniref:Uncharacterized protein n=1 Tax=[Emmonsia] crescens TaxID=73230 RepID=A0A2B7ZP03_9EURO|nr:hypothetical protein GX50_02422 [Emmonsia crescens]
MDRAWATGTSGCDLKQVNQLTMKILQTKASLLVSSASTVVLTAEGASEDVEIGKSPAPHSEDLLGSGTSEKNYNDGSPPSTPSVNIAVLKEGLLYCQRRRRGGCVSAQTRRPPPTTQEASGEGPRVVKIRISSILPWTLRTIWVGLGISIASFFAVGAERGLQLRMELETEYGIDGQGKKDDGTQASGEEPTIIESEKAWS